jgi:uncharacterized iron-regulated membrane protein
MGDGPRGAAPAAWPGYSPIDMTSDNGQSSRDSLWHRWLNAPQKVGLRRVLFQVHLWIGLALGVYVVMISVTGSAVVFRRELNLWLVPRSVTPIADVKFSPEDLLAAARRIYPPEEVKTVGAPRRADRPVRVSLEHDGRITERLFDPYAEKDLGLSFPPLLRAEEWLVVLHDDLLLGPTGRLVNGLAGILTTVLAITGAVIWWPGRHRWRDSLVVSAPLKSRKFLWQLHSSVGFWAFALVFVWSLTAVYFAFPEPVEGTIEYFDSDPTDSVRPGEPVLLALIQMHFGRFGGLWVRYLWVLLGLLPAVLFVTGFALWWTRVVRRWLANAARRGAVTLTRASTAAGNSE